MLKLLHSRWIACVASLFCVATNNHALALLLPSALTNAPNGWIRLFDGETRFGWLSDGGTEWNVSGGALISDSAQQSMLRTTASFSDFDLKFEARVSGGIPTLLMRVDPQSKPVQSGYSLSLKDGTIAELNGDGSGGPVTDGWNAYEVRAEGTHIVATVNGRVTAEGQNSKNRVGYFELVSPRGSRVEVRSVVLKPLGLDSLYNGSNLDGWRAVDAPAPQNKSKFKLPIPGLSGKPTPPQSVSWSGQSSIHGEGGIGELQTRTAYDDFVLQLSAQSSVTDRNGHPDVELFFRETPNQYGTGYAISMDTLTDQQLRNAKVAGAGSLVGLDKARTAKIGSSQFFTCTVIARAHRLSVWIDGLLVSDYYDSRPEGSYHSTAGAFGIRINDEKAKFDLRDVKAAVLPKGPEPPPLPIPIAAPPTSTSAAPAGATAMPAPVILPGPSPEEKAKQEQVRRLTVAALNVSTPEEAVRINKEILTLDPGDMPAQQRMDKAQMQIDAMNTQRERSAQEQEAANNKIEVNNAQRTALVERSQDELLRGNLNEARDHLNDARRLGAKGSKIDRLQSLIQSRIRNRMMLRLGLGGTGIVALCSSTLYFWKRRGKKVIAYLIALDGIDKGKRYFLNQDVTHIGGVAMDGGKKNEVLIRDPDRQVSRFHCEVHKRGNSCYLIDLDSSNGTYLNNRPLPPGTAAKLRNGDKFTLARSASLELHMERQRKN